MPKKIVNVSIKPRKLFFGILIIAAVVGIIYFTKSNSKKASTDNNEREIVLPRETGVADSGFEGQATKFAALNAKVTIDTYSKIDGVSSLKIAFSDQSVVSVKIPAYLNNVGSGNFYRLSFWAKSDSKTEKQINLRVAEMDKTQDLGRFTLNTDDATYFEFPFQAENDFEDLIFTSDDAIPSNVWMDDVLVEKLNVNSTDELKNLTPTIFGDTTWKNIDQSQENKNGNSVNFLATPNRKIGQIFQPEQAMLSGVAFRVTRTGSGGKGNYSIQLREFNQDTGVISDDILASVSRDFGSDPETLIQIKEKETQMRSDFSQREQDIKTGKIPQDKDEDHYPDTFTQDQIDAAKAAKRAAKLENDVRDMKENFNLTQEYDIPLAAKLDPGKKYWIGIDNAGVAVDQNNYISVSTANGDGSKEKTTAADGSSVNVANDENNSAAKENTSSETPKSTGQYSGGFASEIPGTWSNSDALWFETFYPKHSQVNNVTIMSGATITDQGSNNFIYRYDFGVLDYKSDSGFSGRKIYDMYSGNFKNYDIYGNYKLSGFDDFAIYKFNTLYPAKKITIQSGTYHQSLAIEFSTDGENWEEIYSENPAENNQTINPTVITPEEKNLAFYFRVKPAGNDCLLFNLSLEAELKQE